MAHSTYGPTGPALNAGSVLTTGPAGSVVTTGSNGTVWLSNNSGIQVKPTFQDLNVKTLMEVQGEFLLNGVSVDKRLSKLEDYFGIINTNDKLEDRWEDLKKLGEEYRKLEAHLLKKEQVWAKLKND